MIFILKSNLIEKQRFALAQALQVVVFQKQSMGQPDYKRMKHSIIVYSMLCVHLVNKDVN